MSGRAGRTSPWAVSKHFMGESSEHLDFLAPPGVAEEEADVLYGDLLAAGDGGLRPELQRVLLVYDVSVEAKF